MASEPTNLSELLDMALPVAQRHIPQRIRDVAHSTGMRAALVGGVPRDLLRVSTGQLSRDGFIASIRDLDVVVEHNAVTFAYELRRRLPGEIVVNEQFKTATLTTSDPLQIDLATARFEEYPIPGRLPVVDTLGVEIEQDMARRDFTANAMALDLSDDYGALIDPLGGAGDIAAQILRILHSNSFSDDPTRLFRALRYSMRLNYNIEPVTMEHYGEAIQEAVTDHLTPERIRYELECIARESRWAEVWALMDLSGLAASISPQLAGVAEEHSLADARALDITLVNRPDLLESTGLEPWLVRTGWELSSLTSAALEVAGSRAGLFPRHIKWMQGCRAVLREQYSHLAALEKPSEIVQALEHYPRQSVVLAAFIHQPRSEAGIESRRRVVRYLEEWSGVRSELGGQELLELGVRRGKSLAELRDRLRYMRLDGVLKDLDAERAYVEKVVQSTNPDGSANDGGAGDEEPEV